MVSHDFDSTAVARLQIFTLRCQRISVSHTGTTGISFVDTGHRAPLRLAYRFTSKKLLNTVLQYKGSLFI
jgi:hypothetical protein